MKGGPPIPPVVGQLVTLLPDGSIDPASRTDCGESCVSSVLAGFGGLLLSPGCIRQALYKPAGDGRTTETDILKAVRGLGLAGAILDKRAGGSSDAILRALFKGKYSIVLGYFQGREELHWVVVYGVHRLGLWVMDPWANGRVKWSKADFAFASTGTMVHVWDPFTKARVNA